MYMQIENIQQEPAIKLSQRFVFETERRLSFYCTNGNGKPKTIIVIAMVFK